MKSYLNLGCGTRFHPAWTNIDFTSSAAEVVSHNLRNGIPSADDKAEVIYHSHMLEHFSREDARAFLRECRRVLKPGGIIRVVVPNLQSLAETYLQALEGAAAGDEQWGHNHEYVMLELYDQAVRERPGGELGDYLHQPEIPNLEFVLEQGGIDAQLIIEEARRGGAPSHAEPANSLSRLPRRLYGFLRRAGFGREALLRFILGPEYDALRIGRFRRRGEPHLWMYDRYSLLKLLREVGFEGPQLFSPSQSQIPNWTDFHLDTEPDGTIYKPFSLYAEARK
jgi:predicted SAM-dependent methyltransferase